MSWIKLVLIFSNIPICGCMVLALVQYKRLNKELKIFSWFIFVSAIVQCFSLALWFFSIHNLFLNHFFVPISAICIAIFYNSLLSKFINSNVIWTVLTLFLLTTIANSVFIQPLTAFNSYALAIQCVLVVILSLATFLLLMNYGNQLTNEMNVKSLNWINSGLFIYYASVLILFYFGDIIIKSFSMEVNRYVWLLHSLFYIIMSGCFFIGLWKRPRI
ncbi:MAG: hypothetical protein V4651_14140 [Bacteroidota bacterium]